MNAKQALQAEYELREKHKDEIEKARYVDAESFRLRNDTSIACGHRDRERDYITVAEFDLQLCDECRVMIIEALQTDGN